MPYSTQVDLEAAIGAKDVKLYANDVAGEVADPVVVARAIEDADNEIDGYLRGRYGLPIVGAVPLEIREISVDLAVYRLHQRRYPTKISEAMQARRANAIKRLERIQSGVVVLLIDAAAAPATEMGVSTNTRRRLFGCDTLSRMP